MDQKRSQSPTANSEKLTTIIIGVGSMGAAACYELARRGQRVVGLEQFSIPHENGSHAGQSRIIRNAYFEHPDYVPLLKQSYRNWRAFEKQTGKKLYYQTGIVYFGKPDNENIRGIRNAARIHDLEIENWTRAEQRSRYPTFEVPDDFDTIFEPDAGFLTPERAIKVYVEEAVKLGAVVKTNTPVLSWRKDGDGITVVTADETYRCGKLIITAGAWTSRLIPQLNIELNVTRQYLAWVMPRDPDVFAADKFPCWFVEDPALGTFYGFPYLSGKEFGGFSDLPARSVAQAGLKFAHHHPGAPCDPATPAPGISSPEEDILLNFLRTYLPAAGDNIVAIKHCLYTYAPDTHFIIDFLPGYGKDVVIACGFSGHGFKFVPVVGEVLADFALDGKTELPVEFLGLERF